MTIKKEIHNTIRGNEQLLKTNLQNESDYIKGHEDCKKKILKLIDTMPRMIEKNFLMKELEGE